MVNGFVVTEASTTRCVWIFYVIVTAMHGGYNQLVVQVHYFIWQGVVHLLATDFIVTTNVITLLYKMVYLTTS